MGIEGFRCDMVFMVPVEFWQWAIPQVKEKYPNLIFIAEIYDVNQYRDYIFRGKFDFLYDKVNLYDTLRAVMCGHASASSLTQCWQTVDGIGDNMLNFLENHDEQRIASEQFAGNSEKGRAALVVSATLSRGPVMIYAGQELGEKAADSEGFSGYDGRTTIFDYWSVPTLRRWYNNGKCNKARLSNDERRLRDFYTKVLKICNEEKAISLGSFFDLMYVNYDKINPNCHYTYRRHDKDETLLVVANFDSSDAVVNIEIPIHAFNCLNLAEGQFKAEEILHGGDKNVNLAAGTTFEVAVKAYNAAIWKLIPKKVSCRTKKL